MPPEVPKYFFESGALSQEQIDRKMRSEAKLHGSGIPINPHLPCIEAVSEVNLREPQEVYRRFVALTLTATCAAERGIGDPEGDIDKLIGEIVAQLGADEWFTEREREFLNSNEFDMHESTQLSWRYEAAWPLYWAMKQGGSQLDKPTGECDVALLTLAARDDTGLASNGLRNAASILDEADLIYRYHWAIRQASLDGDGCIDGVNPGIVMERHHALNWLIRSGDDDDWENVTTDT